MFLSLLFKIFIELVKINVCMLLHIDKGTLIQYPYAWVILELKKIHPHTHTQNTKQNYVLVL
jgi:hypothetical protein